MGIKNPCHISVTSVDQVPRLSAYRENKSNMRSEMPRISQKQANSKNIVSNNTSSIPMVQHKQAAAVCTGKRDIKVKALEVAKAEKRREQEKENERKGKKEAFKLERAARKRQREEDEKKHLAQIRKLVAEAQKKQKLPYEKPCAAGKVELEKQHFKTAAIVGNKKGSDNPRQNKNTNVDCVQSRLRTEKVLETSLHEMSPVKAGVVKLTVQNNSYDMSPYQSSDEEDLPARKFVPSWASRNHVAMNLPLQQNIVRVTIFPVESFGCIYETTKVIKQAKHRLKQT